MNLQSIFLKSDSEFSSFLGEWAVKQGIEISDYDFKTPEHSADGLLLINHNQDIEKEMDDVHAD